MTEPFLRPAPPDGAPPQSCPPGRCAQPAGVWGGEAMEVVYDPTRHDVVFFRGAVSATVEDGLRRSGWEQRGSDGANHMWTRDRLALARRRLERTHGGPGVVRIGRA
jgi:hypothetical protein